MIKGKAVFISLDGKRRIESENVVCDWGINHLMKCAFVFTNFGGGPYSHPSPYPTNDPRFRYFMVGDCSCMSGGGVPVCDAASTDVALINQIGSTRFNDSNPAPDIGYHPPPAAICGLWVARATFAPGEVTCDCSAIFEWGIATHASPEEPHFVLFNHACIDGSFADPEAGFYVDIRVEMTE